MNYTYSFFDDYSEGAHPQIRVWRKKLQPESAVDQFLRDLQAE